MDVATLAVIGLVVGFVGGLLGVGGSIILIPALTEVLGPDQHLYQAAAMIVNFLVAVPAVVQHRRVGAIDGPTVRRIIPLATFSIVVGVGISELHVFAGDREVYLRGFFGLFLMACGFYEIHRLIRRGSRAEAETIPVRHGWLPIALVAVPTGLVGGWLGVGGGLLSIPLQRRLLNVSIRTAIANSAAIIIATSFLGAIVKNYAYMAENDGSFAPVLLAFVVGPTAIVGSLFGGRLTHRLPARVVRWCFVVVLLASALRMTWGAAKSLPATVPPATLSARWGEPHDASRRAQPHPL